MKRNCIFLAFILLIIAPGVQGGSFDRSDLRLIYRLNRNPYFATGIGTKGSPITFGLSQFQIDAIKALTEGSVDFSDLYSIDVSNSFVTDLMSRGVPQPGSVIYPNIPPPGLFALVNGDPELTTRSWLRNLNVKEAWTMASGKDIIIADCDAGFLTEESDIHDNLLLERRYDFSDPAQPLVIDDGPYSHHGTAVSAIMVGIIDGRGTNGIAFDSKVIPFQNYNYAENDSLNKEEATARCILGALKYPDVRIIVVENQTRDGSAETFVGTQEAIKLAIAAGVTVVVTAGNSTKELTVEEQFDTGSILVGAVGEDFKQAFFSNFGKRVTVSAFGERVWTLTTRGGLMGYFKGTSAAAPQVAGAVALMLEVNPQLTPQQVRTLLSSTARKSADNERVGGLLDVFKAVQAAKTQIPDSNSFQESLKLRKALDRILGNSNQQDFSLNDFRRISGPLIDVLNRFGLPGLEAEPEPSIHH